MFKKFAAEALGLSDIGIIVSPKDYDKVDADDYLFHEDHEKIYFLIKSKKDEYCFTNLALIHVDGESAISAKRTIKRYDYAHYAINGVTIETAGTIDLDIELKFTIGEKLFNIDVRKDFLEQLKDIYKALHTIGKLQRKDEIGRSHALSAASVLGSMFKINNGADATTVAAQYRSLIEELNDAVLERHTRRDFSTVFEKYIHA
ncbi:PH domain-containing protein [Gemmatimonas sp.]|uniref:PH domain-containing protein n=1 Tax=Gemmatimonas sp. TaxID=1962908 RepID=UPI00333FE3B5